MPNSLELNVSPALRIRTNADHWLLEVENLGNEKSPHRCNLHWREQPAWACGIPVLTLVGCVLHTPIIIR